MPINKPLFEPNPPVIQFSDYEALAVQKKIFRLRNNDLYSRNVKIIQPERYLFFFNIWCLTQTKIFHI